MYLRQAAHLLLDYTIQNSWRYHYDYSKDTSVSTSHVLRGLHIFVFCISLYYLIFIADFGASGCYSGWSDSSYNNVRDFVMLAERTAVIIDKYESLKVLQFERLADNRLYMYKETRVKYPGTIYSISSCYAVAGDLSPNLYYYKGGYSQPGVYQGTMFCMSSTSFILWCKHVHCIIKEFYTCMCMYIYILFYEFTVHLNKVWFSFCVACFQ